MASEKIISIEMVSGVFTLLPRSLMTIFFPVSLFSFTLRWKFEYYYASSERNILCRCLTAWDLYLLQSYYGSMFIVSLMYSLQIYKYLGELFPWWILKLFLVYLDGYDLFISDSWSWASIFLKTQLLWCYKYSNNKSDNNNLLLHNLRTNTNLSRVQWQVLGS